MLLSPSQAAAAASYPVAHLHPQHFAAAIRHAHAAAAAGHHPTATVMQPAAVLVQFVVPVHHHHAAAPASCLPMPVAAAPAADSTALREALAASAIVEIGSRCEAKKELPPPQATRSSSSSSPQSPNNNKRILPLASKNKNNKSKAAIANAKAKAAATESKLFRRPKTPPPPQQEELSKPAATTTGNNNKKIVPTPHDVVSGKGGKAMLHNGHFTRLCREFAAAYSSTTKRGMAGKRGIALRIVKEVKQVGRFLKSADNGDDDCWVELTDMQACDKVAHCIRDLVRREKITTTGSTNPNVTAAAVAAASATATVANSESV